MSSKYKYRMTPLASQDMDSALGYIAENLCNEKAARELYFGIERGIETICEFPYSSPDCKLFLITDEKIRHMGTGRVEEAVALSRAYVYPARGNGWRIGSTQ